MSLHDIMFNIALAKDIGKLAAIQGGVMRNFVLRTLVAKDQKWWQHDANEWKITAYHPGCDKDDYPPTFWEDEAIRLCNHEIVVTNFGLSFLDLMELDVPTFERIRDAVFNIEQKQQAAMPKELKEQLSKQMNKS